MNNICAYAYGVCIDDECKRVDQMHEQPNILNVRKTMIIAQIMEG